MSSKHQHDERYLLLAEKWLNGTITPLERQEYADWYNSIEHDKTIEVPVVLANDRTSHQDKILKEINRLRTPVLPIKRKPFIYKIAAAASLLLFVCTVVYLVNYHYKNTSSDFNALAGKDGKRIANDISPGTVGSILTLSNGKAILIDTLKNGSIEVFEGNELAKADESLHFEDKNSATNVEYYTLATPNARQQQLTLPDGSKVWLNAASSIKFPSAFIDKNREVEITGEAYFEVAKDKAKPFIVKVRSAQIEVLGTHFNVMAYTNEAQLETTLVEGAVRLSAFNEALELKPGQQGQLFSNNKLHLQEIVDVDHVVAWKNGMQSFVDADVKTIMRQVERWYDVEVIYKGEIPQREFSGDIPRSANLSELLRLFEVNDIHFTIDAEQKVITVMP
jgi:transmembrane sensor